MGLSNYRSAAVVTASIDNEVRGNAPKTCRTQGLLGRLSSMTSAAPAGRTYRFAAVCVFAPCFVAVIAMRTHNLIGAEPAILENVESLPRGVAFREDSEDVVAFSNSVDMELFARITGSISDMVSALAAADPSGTPHDAVVLLGPRSYHILNAPGSGELRNPVS